jgi:serine/threonine-protein kinase
VVGAVAVLGAGSYFYLRGGSSAAPTVAQAPATGTTTPPTMVAATPVAATASTEPALEPGTMVISALGLVDPKDARFSGDANAAQAESRADAMRQLVEKAVALYVDKDSITKNYAVLDKKLLSQPGAFIKTMIQEGAAATGQDGLLQTEARAVVKVRDVQKSLNQLSKEERIEFIRNNGDPKVSIQMAIRNADTTQALPPERSMLAENVVKERIKSFGFRVWSADGELPAGTKAQPSDFQIQGEVKLKVLSAKLPASGLTITKTALTSWTIKAIDKASGEEVYLNTINPQGKSWASEDQALAEIGKLVGDEFSKNFFLEHFNFSAQKVNLNIAGLPDAASAKLMLRELRGFRQVLDAQLVGDAGKYQLQLAEGNASDLINDGVLKPLNAKLGQNCFALAGATGAEVNVSFSTACADAAVRAKLDTLPPAGLQSAAGARGKLQGKTRT